MLQTEKENLSLLQLGSNRIKGLNSFSTQNREKDNPDFSPIAICWTGSPFGERSLTIVRYKGAWFQAHLTIMIPIFSLGSIYSTDASEAEHGTTDGIPKCQLFLQVIWQLVNCQVFSTDFPLTVKMHAALQNNAIHYGLNCISTLCLKKVENNLQNPSAVRMAYIDTQTRSPAIHLKQMRKQMVEIFENKY